MWTKSLICLVGLAICACDDGPRADKPAAPATNDPRFEIRELQGWYLVGTPATPGQDLLTIFVDAKPGTDTVDMWVADLPPVRLGRQPDGSFAVQVDIASLPVGAHDVLLAADRSTTAFARVEIKRSAPYYVLVTTDWDFADQGVQASLYQDALHLDHPTLRLTHFVGPYTFTDPAVSPQRRRELVDWLLMNRDTYDDEIGLHIHPYCHFVESAGVTCVTDQSTVYAQDLTGYTIKLGAYDRPTMGTLLQHAIDLFETNGLGRPRTFRAGGWTATLDTLGALADKGFTADTSALNWARIEEWEGVQNGELYRWNMEHWAPIGDTSQPYWVSETSALTDTPPTLPLLEVPDNGAMIDYVTLDEMNGLFDANWDGAPLAAPVTLMMGYHPAVGFSNAEYGRVDGFLNYADQHLANRGLGPVVYITLADLVAVY